MGVKECQRSFAFVALKHRQMNRRLCSGTKRTFFMEMENKRRFFLNMGDGSKKNADPDLLFREKYRITHVTEWRGSRLDSRNLRP